MSDLAEPACDEDPEAFAGEPVADPWDLPEGNDTDKKKEISSND